MIQFAYDGEDLHRGSEYAGRLREANSLATRMPVSEAAALCNVNPEHISRKKQRVEVPTPSEIAERAAAIRKSWQPGEADRRMKLGASDLGWQPPTVSTTGLDDESDPHS